MAKSVYISAENEQKIWILHSIIAHLVVNHWQTAKRILEWFEVDHNRYEIQLAKIGQKLLKTCICMYVKSEKWATPTHLFDTPRLFDCLE